MAINIRRGMNNELVVQFSYSNDRVRKIKSINGRRWNSALKCWIIPYSEDVLKKFVKIFLNEQIIADQYLSSSIEHLRKEIQEDKCLLWLEDFNGQIIAELKLKGYSSKTVKAYVSHIKRFLIYIQKKPVKLESGDIREYLFYLLEQKNFLIHM